MKLTRCTSGHYFDSGNHTVCPSCRERRRRLTPARVERHAAPGRAHVPRPARSPNLPGDADPDRTVGVAAKTLGFEPVVGWLVCIEGASRGSDYGIRTARNAIGRAPDMDICISGDATISRDTHAILSFDPETATFRLLCGKNRSIIYVNDEAVDTATDLAPRDLIRLGRTTLMFVPLCDDRFSWSAPAT